MVSTFREKVYTLAQQIPPGKVMTYGQVAVIVGSPGAARAVGMCMRENPDSSIVPCHRIVSSDGSLTGYAFGGISVKKAKLIKEGVSFTGDKVDLSKSKWDPSNHRSQLSLQFP